MKLGCPPESFWFIISFGRNRPCWFFCNLKECLFLTSCESQHHKKFTVVRACIDVLNDITRYFVIYIFFHVWLIVCTIQSSLKHIVNIIFTTNLLHSKYNIYYEFRAVWYRPVRYHGGPWTQKLFCEHDFLVAYKKCFIFRIGSFSDYATAERDLKINSSCILIIYK